MRDVLGGRVLDARRNARGPAGEDRDLAGIDGQRRQTPRAGDRTPECFRSSTPDGSRRPKSASSKKCASDARISNSSMKRPFSASSACRIRFRLWKNARRRWRRRSLERPRDLERNSAESTAKSTQLSGIDQEKQGIEEGVARASSAAADCSEQRQAEERAIETLRQQQFEMIGREARVRNELISRRETIGRVSAQIDRLDREEAEAGRYSAEFEQQLSAARDEYSGQQDGLRPTQSPFGRSRRKLRQKQARSRRLP